MNRIRGLPAVLLAGVFLAACAGEPATTAEPTPDSTPAPTQPPTQEPTQEPTDDGVPMPSFDLPNSDAELEALLPRTIGGVPITTFSMRGAEFMVTGDDNQEFVDFLNRMGASPDDVSVAFGFGLSADFETSAAIFAFKVAGAGTDQLLSEMRGSLDDDVATGWGQATVGGKSVQRAQAVEDVGNVYLYGVGDIMFFLTTTDEAAAAEVLAGLP